MDYFMPYICSHTTNNVPFFGDSKLTYESVGVGFLNDSSLMGYFPIASPETSHENATINMISAMVH